MKMKIRILMMISFTAFIAGCATSVGPENSLPNQTEWRSIDFEKFRVDSRGYPKFNAIRSIAPPNLLLSIPMAEITDKDLWEIRYRLNNYYLIFSESYNERQCRLVIDKTFNRAVAHVSPLTGKCSSRYLYCIVVDLKGNVLSGWGWVLNPDVVTGWDRAQTFKPLARDAGDWGVQPLFKVVN